MKKNMNIIAVFDITREKLLVCKRRKPPYEGLLNLVGGKLEPDEDGFSAAYRELEEETAITRNDIELIHLMDFIYYVDDIRLEVYFGYLNRALEVHGDENELLWIDRQQDFFDGQTFAGNGNIGHIMADIKFYEEQENSTGDE